MSPRKPLAQIRAGALAAIEYADTAQEKFLDIELARVRAVAYVRRLKYQRRMRAYATERR